MTYSLSSIWLPNAKSQHLLFWSRHPNVVILNNISSGQSWLPASRPWDSVRDGQHCVAHGHWLSEQMKRIWGESISMPPKPKWWLCCRIHGQWTMAHLSRLHSNYPYIPSPGKAVPCVSFRRSQCYFPKFSHSSIFKAQSQMSFMRPHLTQHIIYTQEVDCVPRRTENNSFGIFVSLEWLYNFP